MSPAKKSHSLNIMLSFEDLRRLQRCAHLHQVSMAQTLRTLIRRLDGMLFDEINCCANGQMCALAHLNTPKQSVPPSIPPTTEPNTTQQHFQLSETNQEEPQQCTQTASS